MRSMQWYHPHDLKWGIRGYSAMQTSQLFSCLLPDHRRLSGRHPGWLPGRLPGWRGLRLPGLSCGVCSSASVGTSPCASHWIEAADQRQPRWRCLLKSSGLRTDQMTDSSKSTSSGHLMRTAPASSRLRQAGVRLSVVACAIRHLLDLACAPDVVRLAPLGLGVGDPVAPAHVNLPPDTSDATRRAPAAHPAVRPLVARQEKGRLCLGRTQLATFSSTEQQLLNYVVLNH